MGVSRADANHDMSGGSIDVPKTFYPILEDQLMRLAKSSGVDLEITKEEFDDTVHVEWKPVERPTSLKGVRPAYSIFDEIGK